MPSITLEAKAARRFPSHVPDFYATLATSISAQPADYGRKGSGRIIARGRVGAAHRLRSGGFHAGSKSTRLRVGHASFPSTQAAGAVDSSMCWTASDSRRLCWHAAHPVLRGVRWARACVVRRPTGADVQELGLAEHFVAPAVGIVEHRALAAAPGRSDACRLGAACWGSRLLPETPRPLILLLRNCRCRRSQHVFSSSTNFVPNSADRTFSAVSFERGRARRGHRRRRSPTFAVCRQAE